MHLDLSIIVPAYNEALRLPSYLASIRQYADQHYAGSYELIVVDDGSRDGLPQILSSAAVDWPQLIAMRHPTNQGKGAAVRTGMLAARGRRLLFADADGATPIDQEALLRDAITAGADMAIGSRLAPDKTVTRRRARMRGLIGRMFATFARRWLRLSVRDTQCGFKMFRREVGRSLFEQSQETGYLFDLELLVLADRGGYQVAEVPVNWADIPGGHLSLAGDFVAILLGLWHLRRRLF